MSSMFSILPRLVRLLLACLASVLVFQSQVSASISLSTEHLRTRDSEAHFRWKGTREKGKGVATKANAFARPRRIAYTTNQPWTQRYHYIIIDAPGHRDFIQYMIAGASQADVGLLLVPADENFDASIAKSGCNTRQVEGEIRQHARNLNALGEQDGQRGRKIGEKRFRRDQEQAMSMRVEVGWKKEFVVEQVPVLPISCSGTGNLIILFTNMDWFKGWDVLLAKEKIHVDTLADVLEKIVQKPEQKAYDKLRMPVSGVYKKGGYEVITGCIEQCTVKPDDSMLFVPSRAKANHYPGKVISLTMFRKQMPSAGPGDNVGLLIKGLDMMNMPNVGDVMIQKDGDSLRRCKSFIAKVEVLNHPGQLKKGYCPVASVRTARAPLRVINIKSKMSKEAGSAKVDDPEYVMAGDVAQIHFQPQKPFVFDTFEELNELGRIVIMESSTVVMIRKGTQENYPCPYCTN